MNGVTVDRPDDDELPVLFEDFDVPRWTDGTRDDNGLLVWQERYPNNDEWQSIQQVTLDLNPGGEPDYRQYVIDPTKPLQPYGLYDGSEDWYDISDLAAQALNSYDYEY